MDEHPHHSIEGDPNDPDQHINPDPPRSPGTPEPPDLDVDPEQFLDEGERRGKEDEPPS
ncbi:hypothetical protein [Saccharothrix texasensis]|uniref:Uncharacterized protein n=1 Tax=Saccharothrix texasensis TaxID=103734 RepID=A0A3N1H2R5_9PSEU|nr:hypothetical protein [Saccharothrix texasensis]ROP36799.1 hypothetical protein EDD40_2077 [Saccharothrix texasensis]